MPKKLLFLILIFVFAVQNVHADVLDTENMTVQSALPLGGVNGEIFSAPEFLTNTALQNFVIDANIKNIRFPGGTLANHIVPWSSDTDTVTFVDREGRESPYFIGRIYERLYTYNEIYDYFDSVGANDITWVLDVANHTPAQIRALTDSWGISNRPVSRVEFGNELYFPGWEVVSILDNNANGTNADEYLNKCTVALTEIRNGTFTGKTGIEIPIPNLWGSENMYGDDDYRTKWIKYLKDEADTSAFDAIIIHTYLGGQDYEHSPKWVEEQVAVAKSWFPGKEIWVTEHNLSSKYNSGELNPDFNTFYHAVYLAREFAALTNSGATVANQHSLIGRVFEMIGPSEYFVTDYPETAIELRRTSYFPVYFYNKASANSTAFKVSGYDTDFGYIMFQHSDGVRLLWWSKSDTVTNVEVEGYTFSAGESTMGQMEDTNGCWRKHDTSNQPPWNENITIASQMNSTVYGLGIGILEFTDLIRADVDQNSSINATDAQLTLRNSLVLSMIETNWQTSATTGDVNCLDDSNSIDAMLILRYSLGLNMEGVGWCE